MGRAPNLRIPRQGLPRSSNRSRRRRGPALLALAAANLAVFGAVVVIGLGGVPALKPAEPETLPVHPAQVIIHNVTVIDGDTIRIEGGDRIRIANIDTPETGPRAKCAQEAELARQATANLKQMAARARHAAFIPDPDRARDRYGRLLGRLELDGVDVGEAQIARGLAQPWRGRRAAWCG
jgi:micrococcal nuclease